MWLTDHTGKRYLDYLQGWAVNCLGHSPQCMQDALSRAGEKTDQSVARVLQRTVDRSWPRC